MSLNHIDLFKYTKNFRLAHKQDKAYNALSKELTVFLMYFNLITLI